MIHTAIYQQHFLQFENTVIDTVEEATTFVKACVNAIGGGFNPDEDFAQYINVETDEHTFMHFEATELNDLIGQAFAVLGDDIYDVCLDALDNF